MASSVNFLRSNPNSATSLNFLGADTHDMLAELVESMGANGQTPTFGGSPKLGQLPMVMQAMASPGMAAQMRALLERASSPGGRALPGALSRQSSLGGLPSPTPRVAQPRAAAGSLAEMCFKRASSLSSARAAMSQLPV